MTEPAPNPAYPGSLGETVDLFAALPENERRSLLNDYADSAPSWAPAVGGDFVVRDVRKDAECSDTVGVFLAVDGGGRVTFRVGLGPEVQTLTRAMATVLCRAFKGATPAEVLACPRDFVPKIVGAELVRQRSQTVYYMLDRMKQAVAEHLGTAPESD